MKSTSLLVMSALSVLGAWACGKNASDDDSSGGSPGTHAGAGGSSAGAGGAGGTGAGGVAGKSAGAAGAAAGPPITSAPPAWMAPADCGGIGERCADLSGCGAKSVCQLEGNVCIPSLAPGATALPGRTTETPYCAAYTCMTFEQASCFCTGEAATVTPSCSSPSALAGLCAGKDAGCTGMACCDGLRCVDTNGGKRCEQTCSAGSECTSGCCTDLYDTGTSLCAEQSACTSPCKKHGEKCQPGSDITANDCCRGSCVQSDNPDYDGCRPNCSTNEQCDTGCCVPFSGSTNGFCADPKYCSCPAEGGACGPGLSDCCTGMTCAGSGTGAFECHRACTTGADCSSGECHPLSDNSSSICVECVALGATCSSEMGCCGGNICAGTATFTCHAPCTMDQDCPTGGTCATLEDGTGECEVPSACVADDATCGPDTGECCDGLCITSATSATGTCRKLCSLSSDCPSQCCGNSGAGSEMVCLDASACQ